MQKTVVAIGLALIVFGAVQDVGAFPGRSDPPFRNDLVARFTSGSVRIDVEGEIAVPSVVAGRLSLSTNDVGCAPAAGAPCLYTINELRLRTSSFSVAGADFRDVVVVNNRPAADQQDDGSGLHIRPVVPFWVLGRAGDEDFGILTTPEMGDVLDIVSLTVDPTTSRATVTGTVSGTVEGLSIRVTLLASADSPFENVAPFADAGPDVSATTNCISAVAPDSSGTVDSESNLRSLWWEISGNSVGSTTSTVALPPGEHDLTLVAVDEYGGLGTDTTHVSVVDDGASSPLAGAEIVRFEVPAGMAPENFALVANTDLTLQPNTSVRAADDRGASIAALGDLLLGVDAHVGETYAGPRATLRNRAFVEGALHVDGIVDLGRDVRIDGGTIRDGPFRPGAVTSFYVPAPSDASISLWPGESAVAEPGSYDVIELKPRSVLELQPGVYAARELRIAPGARLVTSPATGGPTVVAVTTTVVYHGAIESSALEPSLLIAYLGSNPWHVHTAFDGWIVAPNAEVVLAGAEHRGSFVAREIRVLPNAVIRHVPLSFDFVRTARGACALEPRVHCVREGGSSPIAVFGYTNELPHFGAVVPIGPFNRLLGGEAGGFPRQAFLPRGEDEAFEVAFESSVTWVLGGRSATATIGGPACP
ncbi:MAG: hypothetical protein M3Q39_04745 [Actinomycetota bacterium]|nr:hypothetical protein [Actinomycetota bacterium]